MYKDPPNLPKNSHEVDTSGIQNLLSADHVLQSNSTVKDTKEVEVNSIIIKNFLNSYIKLFIHKKFFMKVS